MYSRARISYPPRRDGGAGVQRENVNGRRWAVEGLIETKGVDFSEHGQTSNVLLAGTRDRRVIGMSALRARG